MALFIGGPYDGRELEFDPELGTTVRLPEVEEWDSENDPGATLPRTCPFVYEYDATAEPPSFRFVTEEPNLK